MRSRGWGAMSTRALTVFSAQKLTGSAVPMLAMGPGK